ncbi:hypothetical protein HWV62_40972 [Athelia sp. TMB]|nr:hypothetical protein HWV62_40972 [Athelia sp. TMB]
MSTQSQEKKKTSKRNTHVLRGTFTAEEVTFLEAWLPKYLLITRVRGKKFPDFWGPLFHDYFISHPLPELTPEEFASGIDQGERIGERQAKVQKRVKEWLNNHSRTATSGLGKRKLLDLTKETNSRMMAPYQAYGCMNKKEVGPIIDKEWSDKVMSQRHTEVERAEPMPRVTIDFRNSVLKRMLAAEPEDVHKAVDVWRHENRRSEKDGSAQAGDNFDQAESYYQAQLSLGRTMQVILENIQKQSGMIGFFTLVGPRPMYNGELGTMTVFHGQNQAGSDFGDVYTALKWREHVDEPLLKFASTVFPPSVCQSFARRSPHAPAPSVTMPPASGLSTIAALPKEDIREADILKLLPTDKDEESDDEEEDLYNDFMQPLGDTDASALAADIPASPSLQGCEPNLPEGAQAQDETMEHLQEKAVSESPTWDNGAHITPDERRVLMAFPSDIERTNIMNIRLRDCQSLEAGLIEELPPIVAKPVPGEEKSSERKKKKQIKSKEVVASDDTAQRRSDRHKVSDPIPPPPPSPSKRSDNSTPIVTPILSHVPSRALGIDDDTIPTWVEEFIQHLYPLCGDALWHSLLAKWVDLERQLGFPTKGRGKAQMLSITNRPAQIGVWINSNRPWNDIPHIGPGVSEDYSTSWWLWWKLLQPEWRSLDFSRDLRGHGDYNWDETRKGSQNGFGIVLLSLGWWFSGLKTSKGKWGCARAMEDVIWVLDQMLASGQSASLGKRSRGEGVSKPPPSKRGKK